uniref:Uncharacterized protein n=1 Tax=Arundo donax TaxID=35708 RepID=A0A0A9AV96_ARUDO
MASVQKTDSAKAAAVLDAPLDVENNTLDAHLLAGVQEEPN